MCWESHKCRICSSLVSLSMIPPNPNWFKLLILEATRILGDFYIYVVPALYLSLLSFSKNIKLQYNSLQLHYRNIIALHNTTTTQISTSLSRSNKKNLQQIQTPLTRCQAVSIDAHGAVFNSGCTVAGTHCVSTNLSAQNALREWYSWWGEGKRGAYDIYTGLCKSGRGFARYWFASKSSLKKTWSIRAGTDSGQRRTDCEIWRCYMRDLKRGVQDRGGRCVPDVCETLPSGRV